MTGWQKRAYKTDLIAPCGLFSSRAIQIDPSFHAALGVIVVLAVAEVFFATSYYVGRARANHVSVPAVTCNHSCTGGFSHALPQPQRQHSQVSRQPQYRTHLLYRRLMSCFDKAKNSGNGVTRQTPWHVFRKRWTANRTTPPSSRKWRKLTNQCKCWSARTMPGAESSKSVLQIALHMRWPIAV